MMMVSGNFTPESQRSSCDKPRGIGCWNLWGFMNAHKPLVKKTTQEYRRWQELDREGPDSKRVSRITGQDALTLLPKGFTQTVPWNCDYFRHIPEPTVSAKPPRWFCELQDQLHWPVATPTTKTEKEQSWWHHHQDVQGTHAHHEHQVAAPSEAEESTAQRLPSLLWMHCLMQTGYWTQELCQSWFPWTSKEHAQQSKD